MKFQPYLNFDGNCEEAFRFYEKVFGGKIEAMMTFGNSPMAGDMSPEGQGKIMHACLMVGDAVLMASDTLAGQYQQPQGNWVSIGGIADSAEGERIFRTLAEGGQVVMPFEKTFWSPGFGMAVDRFGTPWMINCEGESA